MEMKFMNYGGKSFIVAYPEDKEIDHIKYRTEGDMLEVYYALDAKAVLAKQTHTESNGIPRYTVQD